MRKSLRHLLGIGAMALSAAAASPEKAEAQEVTPSGWLEASYGEPTANLRLYPQLNIGNRVINLQSLIDINDYYRFSKTDLFSSKLEARFGPVSFKPVATLFTDPDGARIMGGPNLSYAAGPMFGFAELSLDPEDVKGKSFFYTYNGVILPKNLGSLGLFTIGSITNIKPYYAEIEATGPRITKGLSPYVRLNLQEGENPTWQAGVSLNPREMLTPSKEK
jgi:hypothetical protein